MTQHTSHQGEPDATTDDSAVAVLFAGDDLPSETAAKAASARSRATSRAVISTTVPKT